MSWEEEYFTIEDYFNNNWIETPIAVDNAGFTPPATGSWVKLYVISGEGNLISLGPNARTRNTGVISVQIYAELNSGVTDVRGLADQAAQIFQNESFDGITCRAASMEHIGEKDGRYQLNVNIPFQRDS